MNELIITIMTAQNSEQAENDIREAIKAAGYDVDSVFVNEAVS